MHSLFIKLEDGLLFQHPILTKLSYAELLIFPLFLQASKGNKIRLRIKLSYKSENTSQSGYKAVWCSQATIVKCQNEIFRKGLVNIQDDLS